MSTSPAPSVVRGDITLQPGYFTSSIFVEPLREDIALLVQLFIQEYLKPPTITNPPQNNAGQASESTGTDPSEQVQAGYNFTNSDAVNRPFHYFKKLWREQGWMWFHFKAFDARARDTFLRTVLRCFSEYFVASVHPLAQAVALFGLFTFFMTQPSTSGPSLHSMKHIPLPIDTYQTLLALPDNLSEPACKPLQLYAINLLRTLLAADAFHILPHSSLQAQNPSMLPREIFMEDDVEEPADGKKKGRPSKRDKARKVKDAVASLDKWVEKNTYLYPDTPVPKTTHTLISHPPLASRTIYTQEKTRLLDAVERASEVTGDAANPERGALSRANEAVLARLKKIDAMAAERGLEVGGEGGDRTGLTRVERAVRELREAEAGTMGAQGGILRLLEGAGLEAAAREEREEV